VGPRTSLDIVPKEKSLLPPGTEFQFPGHPAQSVASILTEPVAPSDIKEHTRLEYFTKHVSTI
jgi:hypothetical protein